MTIDRAIRLLKWIVDSRLFDGTPLYNDALGLAIEALEQVKESRFDASTFISRLLPGETREKVG